MTKLWKFFEYGYLIIAIILLVEGALRWNTSRQHAYFFLLFAVLAVFMFFFRRKMRKKFEKRKNDQS